jgi:RNA dependent RNA polymerase
LFSFIFRLQVLKWSHSSGVASLNRQFIALLLMNGVPQAVLMEVCNHATSTLVTACSSRLNALQACEYLYGNPIHDEVIKLVQCGLWDDAFTVHRLFSACHSVLENMAHSHHIPILHSRYALLVPDPTGLLQENEVYFRSSERLQLLDSESDSRTVIGDVIIARNPSYFPNDMRKVTAVDLLSRIGRDEALAGRYKWWSEFGADVIVCPITGPYSLASQLSGGDYDGDLAWICWDYRLTSCWKCVDRKVGVVKTPASPSVIVRGDDVWWKPYVDSLQTSTLSIASNLLLAWMDQLITVADPCSGEGGR